MQIEYNQSIFSRNEKMKAEKEAQELKAWRMENTRKLQEQLGNIKAE